MRSCFIIIKFIFILITSLNILFNTGGLIYPLNYFLTLKFQNLRSLELLFLSSSIKFCTSCLCFSVSSLSISAYVTVPSLISSFIISPSCIFMGISLKILKIFFFIGYYYIIFSIYFKTNYLYFSLIFIQIMVNLG